MLLGDTGTKGCTMAILELSDIQKAVRKYGESYGVERVFLFGSYARDEETEQSDVDLRVDRGNVSGIELAGLLLDLESCLGISVDLVTTGSLNKVFLEEIEKEEILLYERK